VADPDLIAKLLATMPAKELLRVAPMPEAEHLSSLSADTIEREHADKVVRLSKRRKGVRVIDALMLNNATE